ncbi:hypothetical protein [Kordiimonas marina]|uniref:hypothetical protein n=1 Tax=Kordiimonas marina TaxID=2872312 RepID=UPI001FF47BED|nr:hypothetical protein [Kordiimonas marina]MCJ9429003.1 hypothetical protein [Kordiimonas marina]
MAMRKLTALCVAAVVFTLPAAAQTASKYQALSRELVSEGQAALSAKQTKKAKELYERALVADPANVNALVGLGKTHEAMGLVGHGLRNYRQALELEPNDKAALEAQALAFLKRDLVSRATDNRDKLARLCADGCKPLADVDSALSAYHAQKAEADAPAHKVAKKEGR